MKKLCLLILSSVLLFSATSTVGVLGEERTYKETIEGGAYLSYEVYLERQATLNWSVETTSGEGYIRLFLLDRANFEAFRRNETTYGYELVDGAVELTHGALNAPFTATWALVVLNIGMVSADINLSYSIDTGQIIDVVVNPKIMERPQAFFSKQMTSQGEKTLGMTPILTLILIMGSLIVRYR